MSIEMRKVMASTLAECMEKDKRVVVVDADLSKADGTYPLNEKFPGRMFNVGVQEANMASFAAGLASYGLVPFITTFCPFATRRICDQVAISIAYARLPVKIIGTDPGIAAELNGGTHMSLEDVGIMRGFPGMVVFEPCDNAQLAQALPQIIAHDGPVYIRMFRKDAPDVFEAGYKFELFKADTLREGTDVTLFATGLMVRQALEAAKELAAKGVQAEVVNIHTVKPIDREAVVASLRKTGAAVTCENHSVLNGLGSAIAEIAAETNPVPVFRIGAQDRFGEVGKIPYLLEALGMTPADIVAAAMKAIALKRK